MQQQWQMISPSRKSWVLVIQVNLISSINIIRINAMVRRKLNGETHSQDLLVREVKILLESNQSQGMVRPRWLFFFFFFVYQKSGHAKSKCYAWVAIQWAAYQPFSPKAFVVFMRSGVCSQAEGKKCWVWENYGRLGTICVGGFRCHWIVMVLTQSL